MDGVEGEVRMNWGLGWIGLSSIEVIIEFCGLVVYMLGLSYLYLLGEKGV